MRGGLCFGLEFISLLGTISPDFTGVMIRNDLVTKYSSGEISEKNGYTSQKSRLFCRRESQSPTPQP